MEAWFVSTAGPRSEGGGFGILWAAEAFEGEAEAKLFAANAIARGLRVEAGTLRGDCFKVQVSWRRVRDWAGACGD